MRMTLTLALAVAFLLGHQISNSQNAPGESPSSKHEQVLIRRILAGDGDAIDEAGRSGNRVFVPSLRQELTARVKKGEAGPAGPARVALAKLGETDQLQEEWCGAISGDPRFASIQEIGSVGGWFGIQGLEILLN